jgi:hypothetical protein
MRSKENGLRQARDEERENGGRTGAGDAQLGERGGRASPGRIGRSGRRSAVIRREIENERQRQRKTEQRLRLDER